MLTCGNLFLKAVRHPPPKCCVTVIIQDLCFSSPVNSPVQQQKVTHSLISICVTGNGTWHQSDFFLVSPSSFNFLFDLWSIYSPTSQFVVSGPHSVQATGDPTPLWAKGELFISQILWRYFILNTNVDPSCSCLTLMPIRKTIAAVDNWTYVHKN